MPLCLERKLTLSGEVHTYACELVHYEPGFGILRYDIDREYNVGVHRLGPGDVTCALYWTNRPYTLYCWRLQNGTLLYYFNIADSITLSPKEFLWRDLAIDILIDRNESIQVLDENELPPDIPSALAEYIFAAKAHILEKYRDLIDEARLFLQAQHRCSGFKDI